MTDTTRAHIAVVLDRSGSMNEIRSDAEGGLKAFLQTQREVPGEATVSLYQFDDHYETVYESQPVRDLPDFSLEPRGTTALLDAVGRTVARVDGWLRGLPDAAKPTHVIMVVVTDGLENASREFSLATIKELIAQRKAAGWQFVFLAADQDAFATGGAMAMPTASSYSTAKRKMRESMTAAGTMVARGRMTNEYEFTQEERALGAEDE
jgi:Mg-chelatase subunit ChlD